MRLSSLLALSIRHTRKIALALMVLVVSPQSILAYCPGFAGAPPSYFVGFEPHAIAAGDFNGDGNLDLAVANQGGPANGTVSILLGNTDGTFRSPVTYPAPFVLNSVAVGDFNGDGKVDLVMSGGFNVAIRLGNGDGTFGPATTINVGASAFGIAVADLNGDGKLDVALGGGTTVSVLLGNGDGTFAAATHVNAGTGPYAIVASDFNHDGRIDLATANYGSNNVSVLLGNGNGTFAGAVNYVAGTNPKAVVAADLNGDGNMDVAVANQGGGYGISNVSILIGAANGTFAAPVNYDIGASSYDVTSVSAGDFNGDNKVDLAFSLPGATSRLTMLRGNGDGTFAPVSVIMTADAQAVLAGDFNHDGLSDLAVASYHDSSTRIGHLSILLARSGGSFVTPPEITGLGVVSSAVADFNGDGIPDVVFVGGGIQAGFVEVMLGNGDGTFGSPISTAVISGLSGIAVGDFNGDGKKDVAVTWTDIGTAGHIQILLGNGDGTFTLKTGGNSSGGAWAGFLAVADFNGDGKADIVVVNQNNVAILLGTGSGSFGTPTGYAVGTNPLSAVIGDFNGDGKLDLAVSNSGSNNVSILIGTGSGTFGAAVNYAVGSSPYSAATADFNGDGILDLAVANSGSNSVSILLGNGGGVFASPVNYSVGDTPKSVIAADIDHDGKVDIAVANAGGNSVSILLSNGDGTFTLQHPPDGYEVGLQPDEIATGDFNRDGTADVITTNAYNGSISILLNACTPPPSSPGGLIATAQSSSLVNVVWTAVTGATNYQVERRSSCCVFTPVATVTVTSYADTGVAANRAYLYRVRAVNVGGASAPSNSDIATTVAFTDDPLTTSVVVNAVHLAELRTAVNAVRFLAGLPGDTFTDSASAGTIIKGTHVTEVRASLDNALYLLTLPYGGYTDAALVGLPVKAVHFQEIRNRVK